MKKPSLTSPAFREFNVRGWKVLTPIERAEREEALRRKEPPREAPPNRDYQGTELHRPPSIPESRFRAFELPSRAGDLLFYPDGRVEPFPTSTDTPPPAR